MGPYLLLFSSEKDAFLPLPLLLPHITQHPCGTNALPVPSVPRTPTPGWPPLSSKVLPTSNYTSGPGILLLPSFPRGRCFCCLTEFTAGKPRRRGEDFSDCNTPSCTHSGVTSPWHFHQECVQTVITAPLPSQAAKGRWPFPACSF